ncbi:MAG: S24/S26 family peptidase, partial [Bacteroidia bacterium]|nr:S24/S26 family peptidase [Bacteroidia bacterium]
MESLIIPNEIFFSHITEEINLGNTVKIPVKGNSMLPFIHPFSDEIELRGLSENSLEKGNIVLAKTTENKYVVHRIEKVGQETVVLRGDGNLSVREVCGKNNIFAEITAVYKKNKKIEKNSFRWNVAKRYWFSNA